MGVRRGRGLPAHVVLRTPVSFWALAKPGVCNFVSFHRSALFLTELGLAIDALPLSRLEAEGLSLDRSPVHAVSPCLPLSKITNGGGNGQQNTPPLPPAYTSHDHMLGVSSKFHVQ